MIPVSSLYNGKILLKKEKVDKNAHLLMRQGRCRKRDKKWMISSYETCLYIMITYLQNILWSFNICKIDHRSKWYRNVYGKNMGNADISQPAFANYDWILATTRTNLPFVKILEMVLKSCTKWNLTIKAKLSWEVPYLSEHCIQHLWKVIIIL